MILLADSGLVKPKVHIQLTLASTDIAKNVDKIHASTARCVNSKFSDAPQREFVTRWDEARRVREAMKERRNKRKQRYEDLSYETMEMIVRALSRRDLIHRRLKHGFRFWGGEIGGRWRDAFVEQGLRSEGSHNLRRIVQITPRWNRMLVGRGKDVMFNTDAKIFGLDAPWVVLNSDVRSAFRIDLDVTFASWDALRYEIERLPLPCLPHLAVGFEDEEGRIERPHVIFLLPFDQGIWFSTGGKPDERCRQDVIAFFRGVHAGITKLFLPLGADPGALSNPMRIKNPLSPFWSYRAWNEDAFPCLADWAGWVDTSSSRTRMIRESAAALAGSPRKSSNVLFSTYQAWCYDTLRALHRANDPAYAEVIASGQRDRLGEILLKLLIGRASQGAENQKQAQAILYRVTDYAAEHWDPARCSHDARRDLGACADAVAGIKDVAARKAVGARYASDLRRSRSAQAVREAIKAAEASGEHVTVSGIARRTGLDRKTVRSNWPDAAEVEGVGNSVYSKKGNVPHDTDPTPIASLSEPTSPLEEASSLVASPSANLGCICSLGQDNDEGMSPINMISVPECPSPIPKVVLGALDRAA